MTSAGTLLKKIYPSRDLILILLMTLFFTHLGPNGFDLSVELNTWYALRLSTILIDCTLFIYTIRLVYAQLTLRKSSIVIVFLLSVSVGLASSTLAEIMLRRLILGGMIDLLYFTFYLPILFVFASGFVVYLILNESRKGAIHEYVKYYNGNKGKTSVQVNANEVAYFYIENGIVYLYTLEGNKLTLNHSMETIEKTNNSELFFRLNRQCIVARAAVDKHQILSNRKVTVTIRPNSIEQIISKAKASQFKRWLKNETI